MKQTERAVGREGIEGRARCERASKCKVQLSEWQGARSKEQGARPNGAEGMEQRARELEDERGHLYDECLHQLSPQSVIIIKNH